jgi:hypothetical protein
VRKIPVAEVQIRDDGRFVVVPRLRAGEDLALIYRAAMEVSWEEASSSLVSPILRPGGWSCVDWFRQIVAAVAAEYGAKLIVDSDTSWREIAADLRRRIEVG